MIRTGAEYRDSIRDYWRLAGTSIGESVVAFRLAREGEAPSLWSRTVDRPGGRFWSKVIMLAIALMAVIALWRWRRRAGLRS